MRHSECHEYVIILNADSDHSPQRQPMIRIEFQEDFTRASSVFSGRDGVQGGGASVACGEAASFAPTVLS